MSRTLKISLAAPTPDLVHEFQNFGEELYLALRNECAVSIDEIDASTREFHIRQLPKRSRPDDRRPGSQDGRRISVAFTDECILKSCPETEATTTR